MGGYLTLLTAINEADDGNKTPLPGQLAQQMMALELRESPDASIMPIRVLGNDFDGYTSDMSSAGVYWSADNGADVINLSLGPEGYSQVMADAIAYASNKGSVVVMAAGNFWQPFIQLPMHQSWIAVGAVDKPAKDNGGILE